MLCLPVLPAREVAVAYLSACGFDMFEEDGDALVAYAKEDELVVSEYTASLIALRAIAEIRVEEKWMESENWNAKWESNYAPIDVDGKIMMRAPFHAPPSTGLDIVIQPEMSFGTGHHPTTWQMMNAVHGLNPVNQTVLDMGCGTGALAIAASRSTNPDDLVLLLDFSKGAIISEHGLHEFYFDFYRIKLDVE